MLEIKVNLPLSMQEARQYFIDADLIKTWLCADAVINPEVGGAYELFWDLEDLNHNCTLGCKITSLNDHYVSFDWKGPIQYEAFMNQAPLTHVVIVFKEEEDFTQVSLLHSGWGQGTKWLEAENYFKNAWTGALKNLKEML